jgi:hypothetical protein
VLASAELKSVGRDPWFWAVLVFSVAYCVPVFRLLGSLSDEGVIVHGAVRIVDGQVPYRDFFEFLGPGSFFVLAGWLKVFGATFDAVRLLLVATLALIVGLSYVAARMVSGHRVVAAALTAAWLIRAPHDTNHHWFTTAASMACAVALLFAVLSPPARLACFTAGLFAGAAAMTTQTRGAMLVAAVLVVLLSRTDRRRTVVMTLAGISVVPLVAAAYFTAVGALGAALTDAVVFPLRQYARVQVVGYGAFASAADAGVLAAFPLTFILIVIAKYVREMSVERLFAPLALASVGFLGAYPRPDATHLAFVIPLAIPALALAVSSLTELLKGHARVVVAAGLIGVWAWHMADSVLFRIAVARAPLPVVATARGVFRAAPGVRTRDLAWLVDGIERHTAPADAFFFYPYMPMLPFLTQRHHAAHLDVVIPGYTTPGQFGQLCAEAVRAEWVVIDRVWLEAATLRAMFPAMVDPAPPEQQAFELVLSEGFVRVAHSPSFEVRRRTPRATPALCARIPQIIRS